MGTSGARPQCQPTSRCLIVHFVRLYCSTPLLKGPWRRLISWWHMHVDPQPTSTQGSFAGPFPHFSVITVEKTGGSRRRRSEDLPRTSIAIKLTPFFSSLSSFTNRADYMAGTHVPRYCCRDFAYLTEILATGISKFLQFFRRLEG